MKLYQDTSVGQKVISEIIEKGVNVSVEGTGATTSVVKIDGVQVASGVNPQIKGFLEGLNYALSK